MPTTGDPYDRRKTDPWRDQIRRDIDARHKENRGDIDDLKKRVAMLEGEAKETRLELAENTRITRETSDRIKTSDAKLDKIQEDISSVLLANAIGRALKKTGGFFSKVLAYGAPIIGAIAACVASYAAWYKK